MRRDHLIKVFLADKLGLDWNTLNMWTWQDLDNILTKELFEELCRYHKVEPGYFKGYVKFTK